MNRASRIDAALALIFVAAISALAVVQQRPPASVPKTAPPEEFSAERAMDHVRVIAERPHPVGSADSARVRAYLAESLATLGYEPSWLTHWQYPGVSVVAQARGTRPEGKALMLCAHYDSRAEGPTGGPGAGDDASGVAAILETLRALEHGPRLANDLIVLFTDGEEQGLTGARAFIEDTGRRDRVGLVLNFEARGSRGPSYLFETSADNGWLIREFARATPHPIASSLTGAVYREMPNSSDLTMFKSNGIKGLNFAFVDGYENYHRPTDTPENLSTDSLQHQGTYALALTRHFGNLDLTRAASEPDAIYFHAMGPHLIHYPGWLAPALMIAALVGFGVVTMQGVKRGRLTTRGLILGAVVAVAAIVFATGVAWGAWQVIARSRPMGVKGRGSPEIAVVLMVLGFVAALLVYVIPRGRITASNLAMGGLYVWLALTVAATLRLPGASYLFVWPSLFGLIGIAARVFAKSVDAGWVRAADYLAVLPALVLIPPTLQGLCAGLGPNLPFVPAAVAGLLVVALVPMLAKLGRALTFAR